MKTLNSIYLKRYKKIFLNNYDDVDNTSYVNALLGNIADLGFTLSIDLINTLKKSSLDDLVEIYKLMDEQLPIMVGSHIKHVPLFRNFPKNIPYHKEYLLNRTIGYIENFFGLVDQNVYRTLSCGHVIDNTIFDMSNFGACPICQYSVAMDGLEPEKKRPKLKELTPFKIIDLGTKEELINIFRNLVASSTPISQEDKDDIETFFKVFNTDITEYLPLEIPLKENVSIVAKLCIKYLGDFSIIKRYTKTATDLLRIITSLSDGDISLKDNCIFKKFTRSERRTLLSILDDLKSDIIEDMLKYKNRWIRIGEILHPSEYKNRYVNADNAFKILRDNIKYETFLSKVDKYLKNKDWKSANSLLTERSGEYIRKLDVLLQLSNSDNEVLKSFNEIVNKVPTRILIQVEEHFKHRTIKQDMRSFFPKGNISKVKVIDDERILLPKDTCDKVINIISKSLKDRFTKLASLGKVYINPELEKYIIPFSQRSASKSLNTITRGSKIPLPDNNTVRMFIHWMESNISTDIDLSAVFYDNNWKMIDQVSFTNINNHKYCKHSGDLRSAPAPRGASEFIDIEIEKAIKHNVRYVVMSVFDYTQHGFVELPICFAGIMGRDDSKKGEIFEPKTVREKFDLTADTKTCIPLILDLENKEMIWADIAIKSEVLYNCVESNSNNLILMSKSIVNMIRPNMYSLFKHHSEARGILVDKKEDADIIFDVDDVSKIDKIMGEFLI